MRERFYETLAGELGALISKLELKSHVAAARVGQATRDSDGDIGGNRPGGGADRRDDRNPDSILKSADYFKRKQARCRTDVDYARVIAEIQRVLEAWRRTPDSDAIEPERGSFLWKCAIADDDRPLEMIVAKYAPISRASVYRYRAKYRGLRKRPSAKAV